jgi:protein HIRA/HIR1
MSKRLHSTGEKKDLEIYSSHISPDGKRLVTAAGGLSPNLYWTRLIQTDGQIRIWSVDAIRHSDNPQYNQPRQLCHMSHTSGVIHSVRFSPNNKYLASGADDKIICIYVLDPTPVSHATSFGGFLVE